MKNSAISQYLPHYIENFKIFSQWKKHESKHYVFFYLPESLAEKEITEIVKTQEAGFKRILDFLKVKAPKQKIKYYLYPNRKIKKELMGDDWYAQAIYHNFTVHLLYTKKIKPLEAHEDTHLLSLPWGLAIGFFQEGLAEYLTGHNWHGQPHEILVKKSLKKNILPDFKIMFSHKNWADLDDKNVLAYYCYAGSMVKFMLEKFGRNKFKKFYQNLNREYSQIKNIRIFKDVYKMTPVEMQRRWMSQIN